MRERFRATIWGLIGVFAVAAFAGLVLKPGPSDAQPMISTAKQIDRRTGGALSVLNPFQIPKYQVGLVFPGVMQHNDEGPNHYNIAVREFEQQILPGGQWCDLGADCSAMDWLEGNRGYPSTTVWSYGPQQDPIPPVAPDLRTNVPKPSRRFETYCAIWPGLPGCGSVGG